MAPGYDAVNAGCCDDCDGERASGSNRGVAVEAGGGEGGRSVSIDGGFCLSRFFSFVG